MNKWRKRARKWKKLKGYESRWADVLGKKCKEVGSERDALLTWQRGVREAWAAYDAEDEVEASTLDRPRQAIEAEPVEPKGEP